MRALIVGSTSVPAQRIVEALKQGGARVVGVDVQPFESTALEAVLTADMSDGLAAEHAVIRAVEVLGGLDVLVTAAAAQRSGRLDQTSDETWRAVMAGTLDTTFNAMRAALPHLRPGSSIVALTSVNAFLAHPGNAAYTAAKGAIHSLVTQAALEYAPRGIRVNAVAPALIDGAKVPDGAAGYPLGRTVTSDEVAAAVAFLASPSASGITGVILPVDAGLSITSAATYARPALLERWRDGTHESIAGMHPGVDGIPKP